MKGKARSVAFLTGLALAVLVVFLLPLPSRWLAKAAERMVAEQTGFRLAIGSIEASLLKSRFSLRDTQLDNPPDFPEAKAFSFRELAVAYDWTSLFSSEVRLREVVLDIPTLVVVRKADGETNAQRLGAKRPAADVAGGGTSSGPSDPSAEAPGPADSPREPEKTPRGFRIETLVVRVGTVSFHDYTRAGPDGQPAVTELALNLDQTHHNLASMEQVGAAITAGALQQAGLAAFQQALSEGDLDKRLQKAANHVGRELEKLFGKGNKKEEP